MLRTASVASTLDRVLDPDIKRFETSGLKRTADGLKLVMAMHEMRCAIYQLERLLRVGSAAYREIDSWRRAYIRASDHGSQALDRLWNAHQWPTDGARQRDYDWHPETRRP